MAVRVVVVEGESLGGAKLGHKGEATDALRQWRSLAQPESRPGSRFGPVDGTGYCPGRHEPVDRSRSE